jgi:anti-sigma regulatory factor (Ser/Thr protein kinase)
VAELLASEVVTNVVQHVGEPMTVRVLRRPDVIRVEVDDASPDPPALYPADPTDEHHRGMVIVDTLTRDWGAVSHPGNGKTVWFELDVAGAE